VLGVAAQRFLNRTFWNGQVQQYGGKRPDDDAVSGHAVFRGLDEASEEKKLVSLFSSLS
jgi:hypothetical protein